MLKTSLLINELTCRIGNTILLVVICCLSAPRTRANPLAVTGCVSALPRTHARTHARMHARMHARAHYFARYLTATVNICTLGINVVVALAGSLVWWDSP